MLESTSDKSVTEACRSGDQLEILKALRLKLARRIDDTRSAREVKDLTKQFCDLLDQINAIESPPPQQALESKEIPLNVVQINRAARMSGAKDKARTKAS